jgi:hypothetical protein
MHQHDCETVLDSNLLQAGDCLRIGGIDLLFTVDGLAEPRQCVDDYKDGLS